MNESDKMEFLKELGYQFDEEALRREYEKMNRELTSGGCDFYKIVTPFICMAYEQGREGSPLSELFPFLKPESVH